MLMACQRKIMHYSGTQPCLVSLALRLLVTLVGRPLPSGSLSAARRQIMWIPMGIGMAAISVAVNHSAKAGTDVRRCHEQRRVPQSTEVTLSLNPVRALHQRMVPARPLDSPRSTQAGPLRHLAPSTAQRQTSRVPAAARVTDRPRRLALTASRRPRLFGAVTLRVSLSAMLVVCS